MNQIGKVLLGQILIHPRVALANKKRVEESPEAMSRDLEQPREGDLRKMRKENWEMLERRFYINKEI